MRCRNTSVSLLHFRDEISKCKHFAITKGVYKLSNKSNYSPDQRLNMILDCRKSGLTDCQWCKQMGIPTGTFYGWVKSFKQKGLSLPDSTGKTTVPIKQEVVKVDIIKSDSYEVIEPANSKPSNNTITDRGSSYLMPEGSAIELSMYGATLKFTDSINPAVLGKTLHLIKELSC